MQYQGGKAKIAKRLAAAILQHTSLRQRYVEPFVGGGNMLAVLAPAFQHAYASDLHPDLILMWQALQSGWEPPNVVTADIYETLRHMEPSALRGFVGFCCSFGGMWFRHYARNRSDNNYAAQGRRAVLRDIKNMGSVTFSCRSYTDVFVKPDDVVYCDPPYANTTGYKVSGGKFDSEAFWRTAQRWSDQGAKVFVSEFTAPPQWQIIWEKECRRNLSGPHSITVVDRLYTQ